MLSKSEASIDSSGDQRDSVEELAEQFAERLRRGEKPTISDYTLRYPQWAESIRDLFPALELMESLKPKEAPSLSENTPSLLCRPMQRLGDYLIQREIGRGGMGVVYEAVQESLGRYVALKVLAPNAALTPTFQERFRREAKAAARLHHTNIVPVFGVGESDGFHYYAMQFIRGDGLDQVLQDLRKLRHSRRSSNVKKLDVKEMRDRSLAYPVETEFLVQKGSEPDGETQHNQKGRPEDFITEVTTTASNASSLSHGKDYFRKVAGIGFQIADALAHAHRQGVIHRDIKPSNLLLDHQGIVWITDFGLAKATDAEDLTNTGDIVGTIRYMAPERFSGKSEASGDIYALGITLYEMLTLQPAFEGRDKLQLISQITKLAPLSPRKIDPQIPVDLETVVLKAIAQDPNSRYASAAEMAEDFQRYLADRPVKARRATRKELLLRWRRRNPTVAVLLGALVFLLLLGSLGSSIAAAIWRSERDSAVSARKQAIDANVEMKKELWKSLKDQAKAGVLSRRRGQRQESLRVIGEAAQLARELQLPSSSLEELRNLAIAALVLPDIETTKSWPGCPEGTRSLAIDSHFETYARANREGLISLRKVSDDSRVAEDFVAHPIDSSLMVSPNGKFVAHLQDDHQLRVWTPERGVARFLPYQDKIRSMCFTPDNRLLCLKMDGSICLCPLESEQQPIQIANISNGRAVVVDARGERFACIENNRIQIRDLFDGHVMSQFPTPQTSSSGVSIAWHAKEDILAYCNYPERTVYLWDIKVGQPYAVLEGFTNPTTEIAFIAGGEILATSGWENQIRLWDWRTSKLLMILPGQFFKVPTTEDGLFVQNNLQEGALELWRVNPAIEYRTISLSNPSGDEFPYEASIHPSGRIIAQATSKGSTLFDLENGQKLFRFPAGTRSVKLENSGTAIVLSWKGLSRYPLSLEPLRQNNLQLGFEEIGSQVGSDCDFDISRDGRIIAIPEGTGKNGASFSIDNGKPIKVTHPDCRRVSLSPDGHWLATGSHHGTGARIWTLPNPKQPVELLPETGQIDVKFSPGGKWLATNSGHLRLWHVESWNPGPILGSASSFAFNSDDSLLAVESRGGRIRLLEPDTGRELARLEDPHQHEASWLGFTPDGTKLIASSRIGKSIHIWDLRLIRTGLANMDLDWDAVQSSSDIGSTSRSHRLVVRDLTQQALAAWSISLAFNPISPEAYYQRALCWKEEHLQDAFADLSMAIKLLPGQYRYHQKRAEFGELLHRTEQLLEDYQESVRLNPQDLLAYNQLAWIYVAGPEKYRDAKKALPLAQRAFELDPNDGSIQNTLAVTLYRSARYREAIDLLNKSRLKNWQNPASDLYFLAMSYHQLGDAERARNWYEQAHECHKEALLTESLAQELDAFRREAQTLLKISEAPR
ncbi:protein kinase [Telmatocola sphagniphila]|uniref:non-specific serine/threonine protein kinase n=1 Tax=Telmatocola sphagniphila TaxID=1123043 RepID=A0A8E6BAE0_9BACT|nr:protein kinase [Telmatocola sphagniphila]QVL34101.1 protein kinase [Telmatocola sphagniphila]